MTRFARTTRSAKLAQFAKKFLVQVSLSIGIVLLLVPGITQTARAVEYDNDGIVEAGTVVDDDLFLEGYAGTAVVDGIVNGNLFVHGAKVVINGQVNGNLLANSPHLVLNGSVVGSVAFSGLNFDLNGTVDGSVYFTYGAMVLGPESKITRNIFATAYSVEVKPGAQVGKDADFNGYQLLIDGEVGRDVIGSASALQIDGKVGRDINMTVESPDPTNTEPFFGSFVADFGLPAPKTPGLYISEDGKIGGLLNYKSELDQSAAIHNPPAGGVALTLLETGKPQKDLATLVKDRAAGIIRSLVTLLIIGGLVIWKMPKTLERTAHETAHPLKAALNGFLAVFLGFPLALLLIVSLVILGVVLAVASLGDLSLTIFSAGLPFVTTAFSVFMLLISYGSKLVFSYAASRWAIKRYFPNICTQPFWVLAAGVVVYLLLRSIPVAGELLGLAATLIGLGAIWLAYKNRHVPLEALTPAEPALAAPVEATA